MTSFDSTAQLWQLLDRLRDDRQFRPCELIPTIATLIYLRWADFQEAELEALAVSDGVEYSPVLSPSVHWRTWHAYEPDDLAYTLCNQLPQALAALGNVRTNPLATHLHRLADLRSCFFMWSPDLLAVVVRWLADQPFETSADRRQLLAHFDQMVAYTLRYSREVFGESIEPAWVSELVAAFAKPANGERVYDPCFGLAGFLVAACDYVQATTESDFHRSGTPTLSVNGVEINSSAFVMGAARLVLAGANDLQLELGSCLERTAAVNFQEEGYDLVVANPPWGMRIDSPKLDHYPIRTNDATGLFIQHVLDQLRPGGRAVIVVPQGMLVRGGADRLLRELMMKQHSLEAVISLPAGVFKPHTAIASAIILLRRGGSTQRIRMVDAERLLLETKKGEMPTSEQIRAFVKLVRSDRTTDDAWFATVDEIADADWDLTPRRRDQSGLETALEHLQQDAPAVRLSECCDIITGRSTLNLDLLNKPFGETWNNPESPHALLPDDNSSRRHPAVTNADCIAYIRISDIRKGVAATGSLWLRPEAALRLDPRKKLRTGDVLLSRFGTIGKVAIVSNSAMGAVPSNGLIILRPRDTRLDPHFLTAYLASAECQAWLQSRTRGVAIHHLSARLLNELPIPLPPLQVQQRIADKHQAHGVDALDYLTQLLVEVEQDPVIRWVDQALQLLRSDRVGKPQDLEPLLHAKVFGNEFSDICIELARGTSGNPLAKWILTLDAVVTPALRDSGNVPQGTALYALLLQAERGLQQAADNIEGHMPHANRARELMRLVASRVRAALNSLLDAVDIQMTASISSLKQDAINECTIQMTNRGSLPLRAVKASVSPWSLEMSLGFLAEGQHRVFHVSGKAPNQGDQFDLTVSWTGIRMDGKECEGSREIAFRLVSVNSVLHADEDFGDSPYICGDPISPERGDVFVGREGLLAQIRRQVAATGNVVLLEGNRRAGKTSILKHLDGPNAIPGWLGVYTSLQGAEGRNNVVGVPTDSVFRTLAREMAKAVHALGGDTPLPNGSTLPAGTKPLIIPKACQEGISTEEPFTDFQAYVEVLLDVLARRGLGLLLMLDEFDKLQEGIDNRVTSPQVPENIRFLVQTYPRFSAILTGSKRLRRLREEYWSALYGLGTRIGVTALDEAAAEQLVTLPVRGRLSYTKEAIRRVVHLTAGQPFLLQCLCNRIYAHAAVHTVHSVTLDQVEQAAFALIEDNEHFASLWDYAGSKERPQLCRYLLALCHREGNATTPLRLGVIQERLLADGIEVNDGDVVAALDHLRELELVDLVGDGIGAQYRISIPLMGTWIDRQRDVDATLATAKIESEDHDA